MINFAKFNNIISLTSYFNTHCSKRGDGRFRCNHCLKNFSCLVGTIFENTKLPLIKWFVAMYLISSHKKGISSHQLSRDLDITQASAWYMLQKIRLLYPQSDAEAFEGTVECDEVAARRSGSTNP